MACRLDSKQSHQNCSESDQNHYPPILEKHPDLVMIFNVLQYLRHTAIAHMHKRQCSPLDVTLLIYKCTHRCVPFVTHGSLRSQELCAVYRKYLLCIWHRKKCTHIVKCVCVCVLFKVCAVGERGQCRREQQQQQQQEKTALCGAGSGDGHVQVAPREAAAQRERGKEGSLSLVLSLFLSASVYVSAYSSVCLSVSVDMMVSSLLSIVVTYSI